MYMKFQNYDAPGSYNIFFEEYLHVYMNKNLSCIKIRLSGFSTEYVFYITGEMYRVSTKLVFHFSKRFIIWSYQSIRHVYNIINSTSFAVSTLRNSY